MLPGGPAGAAEGVSVDPRRAGPKPPKVAVCHLASGDRWAGAEAQIATLLRALARREEFRLYAILLNEGQLAGELRNAGIEVRVIPENDISFFSIVGEASHFLLGKEVEILHSHRYKENLVAVTLAWRCHIPCVVRTQHGMPEPFTGIRRWKQAFLQCLDRFVARHATDCVVSVSDEMRNQLARFVDPGRIRTIHNGLDGGWVHSKLSRKDAKLRLGIQETSWLVGTAGRLDPIKRHDIFLAVAQQISRHNPDARFLIAGEGTDKARLAEVARKLGVLDRVLFLGHRDDIYDVLRALNVFLLCSDHEGLPMVLLEALHLGVPVVARQVGGIPELIENGVNGILVNSSEPEALAAVCLKVLQSDPIGKLMQAGGVDRGRSKFSADHSAAEMASLYRSLLAGKKGLA